MDSWTDKAPGEKSPSWRDGPKLRELLAEEEMVTTPHAEHLYGDGPKLIGEEASAFNGPALLPPVQPVNVHSPEVQRDIERREQLRAEELEHLTRLRDRVQKGMDEGMTDLESGTAMLLNISKARMALAGVGYFPGAF